MKILNPATEEVISEVDVDSNESVSKKVSDARKFLVSEVPLAERKKWIQEFNSLLKRKTESLAKTLTLEMGKPITQSKNEIRATSARIEFFLDRIDSLLANQEVFKDGGLKESISFEPLGVVGNISAWNYPYFVGVNVFVPALLTGNSVLYKPSELVALTGLEIEKLMRAAGVPKGAFQVVLGSGEVGTALLSEDLDGVFFTGSYATGKKIAQQLANAKCFPKLQLELGGKDPSYVCDDVDLGVAAASLADGAFYNAGQSCCAVERIYAHEKVYESFLESFFGEVKKLRVGDPMEDSTTLGPLARKPQLAFLEEQVRDAVSKGGRLLCGGKSAKGKGYFFEPTVFADASHEMKLMREESFGPVIGIQKVSGDEEALEKMNDTEYGLTAGVFTKDQKRAQRILSQVNAGSVYWNCCDRVSPYLPWSGWKRSGLGLTLSEEGIRTFLKPKAWHLRSP